MDAYQPSTAAYSEVCASERREHAREEAYRDGRADERDRWLPLAGELRARILHKHQTGGTVLLTLEDVLAISARLASAERQS